MVRRKVAPDPVEADDAVEAWLAAILAEVDCQVKRREIRRETPSFSHRQQACHEVKLHLQVHHLVRRNAVMALQFYGLYCGFV